MKHLHLILDGKKKTLECLKCVEVLKMKIVITN